MTYSDLFFFAMFAVMLLGIVLAQRKFSRLSIIHRRQEARAEKDLAEKRLMLIWEGFVGPYRRREYWRDPSFTVGLDLLHETMGADDVHDLLSKGLKLDPNWGINTEDFMLWLRRSSAIVRLENLIREMDRMRDFDLVPLFSEELEPPNVNQLKMILHQILGSFKDNGLRLSDFGFSEEELLSLIDSVAVAWFKYEHSKVIMLKRELRGRNARLLDRAMPLIGAGKVAEIINTPMK